MFSLEAMAGLGASPSTAKRRIVGFASRCAGKCSTVVCQAPVKCAAIGGVPVGYGHLRFLPLRATCLSCALETAKQYAMIATRLIIAIEETVTRRRVESEARQDTDMRSGTHAQRMRLKNQHESSKTRE